MNLSRLTMLPRTCLLFLGCLVAGAASAGPIAITNASFEADPMVLDLRPTAYLNPGAPTGWQTNGNALSAKYLMYSYSRSGASARTVFNGLIPHGPTEFFGGQTLAFSKSLGVAAAGSMYQHTGASIAMNTGYRLDVDVFNRWDLSGFTESTFSFFAGDLSNTIKSWSIGTPSEGYFNRQSFSVLADDLLPYHGLGLGISFNQIGHSSLIIDNVALNSFYSAPTPPPPVPVPAPAGGLILMMGFALLCVRSRIRRFGPADSR